MAEFIILFKGRYSEWNSRSPEETQKVMEKYFAFVADLRAEGRMKGGSELKSGGYELSPTPRGVSIDGPFAETRETLGGYMIFEAENYEKAIEIAKRCPALAHGDSVVIHQLTDD